MDSKVDQGAFTELMGEIVAQCFPEENHTFELIGEDVVSDVFHGRSVTGGEFSANYEFGSSEIAALSIVPLVLGTFKTVFEIYKLRIEVKSQSRNKPDVEELQAKWRAMLADAGLSESKSEEVVKRFGKDFEVLLR